MTNSAKHTPGPLADDPHLDAVLTGMMKAEIDYAEAIEILASCGYSETEARAAIAKATGDE